MSRLLTFLTVYALLLPTLATAETRTFVCEYDSIASPDGVQKVDKGEFVLTFILDSETEKAYMLGNVGTEEVSIIPNKDALNFIEVTATGNVMLTTIIWKGGFSIHSRHSIIFEVALPSQYYGHCVEG